MKNKVVTFLCSMGIPISALTMQQGCTGSCGSCNFSCFPGIVLILILAAKYICKKHLTGGKNI